MIYYRYVKIGPQNNLIIIGISVCFFFHFCLYAKHISQPWNNVIESEGSDNKMKEMDVSQNYMKKDIN